VIDPARSSDPLQPSSIQDLFELSRSTRSRLYGACRYDSITHLFAEEEATAHRRGISVAHLVQGPGQACRSAEEDAAVCVGVFFRDGLEDAIPLRVTATSARSTYIRYRARTLGLPKWVGARSLVIVSCSAPTSCTTMLFILSSLNRASAEIGILRAYSH
jgi:hypothetical protein